MYEAQPAEEPVLERGLLTVPDEVWQLAVRRAEVIGPMAAAPSVGAGAVDAAATELGVSRRQVYLLLGRWRAGKGRGLGSDLGPIQRRPRPDDPLDDPAVVRFPGRAVAECDPVLLAATAHGLTLELRGLSRYSCSGLPLIGQATSTSRRSSQARLSVTM